MADSRCRWGMPGAVVGVEPVALRWSARAIAGDEVGSIGPRDFAPLVG